MRATWLSELHPMIIMPATSHKMMPTKLAKRQPHEANAQRVLLAKTEQKKLIEDQPCECITNATALYDFSTPHTVGHPEYDVPDKYVMAVGIPRTPSCSRVHSPLRVEAKSETFGSHVGGPNTKDFNSWRSILGTPIHGNYHLNTGCPQQQEPSRPESCILEPLPYWCLRGS